MHSQDNQLSKPVVACAAGTVGALGICILRMGVLRQNLGPQALFLSW